MNILVDTLPTAVRINGIETPINADFRACLKVILAYEDDTLTALEKQAVLLHNLYPAPPENPNEAVEKAVKFLDGGGSFGSDDGIEKPRLYSFSKDASLIFAAFKQTHNIDLADVQFLHWWKFIALFMDLGADTAFCQLTSLRKRVKTGKATKEERAAAREMGDLFEVPEPDSRTLEEREAEERFMQHVKGSK